jgi:hypothetical protein
VLWFRKFGVVVLAVLTLGVPAMACLTPEAQFTSEERECCKRMAEMCGRGSMPNSHSCCKTTVRPIDDATLTATRAVCPVTLVALAVNTYSEPAITERRVAAFVGPSPPEFPPPAITVLRI